MWQVLPSSHSLYLEEMQDKFLMYRANMYALNTSCLINGMLSSNLHSCSTSVGSYNLSDGQPDHSVNNFSTIP